MRLLREYIRELLTEAAMGPADLPDGVYVGIKRFGNNTQVFYSDADGNRRVTIKPPVGRIAIAKPGRSPHTAQHPGSCLGAWQVVSSQVSDGWGPLLYDVAMEVVGDVGLMADRVALSDDAYNVWKYYMNSRSDVRKKQLDDPDNTLTPEEEDNCDIESAEEHGLLYPHPARDLRRGLRDSPVMKVYTKGPTTIQELESMGRLVRL